MKKLLLGLSIILGAMCGSASAMNKQGAFSSFFTNKETKVLMAGCFAGGCQSMGNVKEEEEFKGQVNEDSNCSDDLPPLEEEVIEKQENLANKQNGENNSKKNEENEGGDNILLEDHINNQPINNQPPLNVHLDDNLNGNDQNGSDLGFFATHQTKLIVVGGTAFVLAATGLVAYTFKDNNKTAKAVFVPYQKVGAFVAQAVAKAKAHKLKTAALVAALTALGCATYDYVGNESKGFDAIAKFLRIK